MCADTVGTALRGSLPESETDDGLVAASMCSQSTKLNSAHEARRRNRVTSYVFSCCDEVLSLKNEVAKSQQKDLLPTAIA